MVDPRDDPETTTAPLSGMSILVTRAAEQTRALAGPLETLGAEVMVMPVIAVAPPQDWGPADEAIGRLGTYDWIVLTSVNGVSAFDARLRLHGRTMADTDLGHLRFAVIGSATLARLREHGVEPGMVPRTSSAEGLVDALREIGPEAGHSVLIPRAAEARELLPQDLRMLGFEVDVVPVYRVVTATPPADVIGRLACGGVSAVVFASGGTARRFVETLRAAGLDWSDVLSRTVVASIGPVTTRALATLGIHVAVEAPEPTAAALVAALTAHLSRARGESRP